MKKVWLGLFACLAAASAAALAQGAPFADPSAPIEAKRIYKCYVDGYDPPVCMPVIISTTASEEDLFTPQEVVAAARAAKTNRAVRRLLGTAQGTLIEGPTTEACANTHGASACCRIIGEVDGIRYIECG